MADRDQSKQSWRQLSTEARQETWRDLDRRSTAEVVGLLLDEDRRGLEAAAKQAEAIAQAADWAAQALEAGGDLVFAGAGTSGRLGILEAAECPPTFSTDPERIRGLIAGGPEAVFRSREGGEDQVEEGAKAVTDLGDGDLLVGLSASSVTPYTRGALVAAREQGARTVLLTCAGPEGLEGEADLLIALATGPEVLAGSTRLKAGSATKAALNAITTAAMVRRGKIFENLMVDLSTGSAKLIDRAQRIVALAGRVDSESAKSLYEDAGAEVGTAILMARTGLPAAEARQLLAEHQGRLRPALESASSGSEAQ